MHVLITGGTGYLGTELLVELTQNPAVDQVVIYDNLNRGNYNLFLGVPKLPTDKIRFVQGELLDSRKLQKEVEKADIVYHLAAKVTTPFADHNPHEFDQVNNWGTAELTYLVEKSNVQRFIYTSSVSVYGSSSEESDIGTPLNPRTFYGISKMNGEGHVQRLLNSNIKTYILRCGNVYGYSKSMRFDSVINKFLFEANFTNRLRIFGNGSQYRSFIHIKRLSTLMNELTTSDLAADTYNLVECSLSVNEVVDELRKLYPSLEMVFVNQNMRMRSLRVRPDERLQHLPAISLDQLGEDLAAFKAKLSF